MKSNTPWYIVAVLSVVALVFDRLAKMWFIQQPSDGIPVWDPIVILRYHLNTDMALSLPLFPWLYYPLIAVVFGALLYAIYMSVHNQRVIEFACILFVLVGAVSNLIDRIMYGGVIDFVSLSIGNVFNIADVYIVVGIIGWCIVSLQNDRKKAGAS